jgi:2-dehydro-3-deoxyphosphogluconate aldolase/(4S)-4-hydroxy-2-oxoglutarate aldolase
MIAGAGTVLSASQAEAAFDAGANFIVSPGLDDGVVAVAKERGAPVYPGIVTPGELQHAYNLGLDVVKFFPASIVGGIPAIKALSSVFRTMRFMPTGGISPGNLADYLGLPTVLACGGSWLTPADAIAANNYDKITTLAEEALQIAAQAKRDRE